MMRRKILFAIVIGVLPFLLWQGMTWRQEWLKQSLVTQLREGGDPLKALGQLVALNARETLPLLKEEFARRKTKTDFQDFSVLRQQLLTALANWLPDQEVVPFLIAVDDDAEEAPMVRFRAVILLCDRGDTPSLEYIAKRYISENEKVEPFLTVESLEKSLKDRRLFASDEEFAGFKLPEADELTELQKGIQLAQHFNEIQQRGAYGAIRRVEPAKVQMRNTKIESWQFYFDVPSETWSFDLRKKGDHWLPCNFRMRWVE